MGVYILVNVQNLFFLILFLFILRMYLCHLFMFINLFLYSVFYCCLLYLNITSHQLLVYSACGLTHVFVNCQDRDSFAVIVTQGGVPDIPGLPNPTFSQTVGSVTTHPHGCPWCHKQYASKAKLLQHQRKKHIDLLPQSQQVCDVCLSTLHYSASQQACLETK